MAENQEAQQLRDENESLKKSLALKEAEAEKYLGEIKHYLRLVGGLFRNTPAK